MNERPTSDAWAGWTRAATLHVSAEARELEDGTRAIRVPARPALGERGARCAGDDADTDDAPRGSMAEGSAQDFPTDARKTGSRKKTVDKSRSRPVRPLADELGALGVAGSAPETCPVCGTLDGRDRPMCPRHSGASKPTRHSPPREARAHAPREREALVRGDAVLVERGPRVVRATVAAPPEHGWLLVKLPGVPGPTSVPTHALRGAAGR